MGNAGSDNVYKMPQKPAGEIVGALQNVLPEAEAESMHGMDQSEAIIFLSKVLVEQGVEDPLMYLKDKGVLE